MPCIDIAAILRNPAVAWRAQCWGQLEGWVEVWAEEEPEAAAPLNETRDCSTISWGQENTSSV